MNRLSSGTILFFSAVLCLSILSSGTVLAQNTPERGGTEKRLNELRDQIANDESRLAETEREEKASLRTLSNLNRQIGRREELVGVYRSRLDELIVERDSLVRSIDVMDSNLDELKTEYRARATHAYKYGRLHDVALILSASSINQMLIRIRYLRRFSDQRQTQLADISQTTGTLKTRRTELQRMLVRNKVLLSSVEKEQTRLGGLKVSRQTQIRRLQTRKANQQVALDEKITEAGQLETRIREALAAANRNRSGAGADATAFAALSNSFENNRGQLPWPTKGAVIEPFGDIINPVYGTRTPNLGILIETETSAEVRAMFEGRVTSIDVMPAIGRYMIIEHGEYNSVYGNFSMFYVAEGQTVSTGQVIGRSGTDAEPKGNAVFIGLFKDGKPIDPAPWLSR